jgi:hypothetical protein
MRAGNYSFDFSSAPTNWVAVDSTYGLGTNSYAASYVTQAESTPRAIAVYNNSTWGTNYTYSVKLNSDYEGGDHTEPGSGNRVGVVFNYVDANNYYELSADDLEVLDYVPCATFPCGPPTHVPD